MTMRIQENSSWIEECRAEVRAALDQCRASRHWHESDLRYLRDARVALTRAMRENRKAQRRSLQVCDFFQFTQRRGNDK